MIRKLSNDMNFCLLLGILATISFLMSYCSKWTFIGFELVFFPTRFLINYYFTSTENPQPYPGYPHSGERISSLVWFQAYWSWALPYQWLTVIPLGCFSETSISHLFVKHKLYYFKFHSIFGDVGEYDPTETTKEYEKKSRTKEKERERDRKKSRNSSSYFDKSAGGEDDVSI